MLSRPDSSEYAEFYKNYIARVPEGNVLDFLAKQPGEYRQLLLGVSEEAAAAEPAPGKWSIKEVLGHVCDAERVMSYRALRFGRGDEKELQGFEQDDYVRTAASNSRSLEELLNEFESDYNRFLREGARYVVDRFERVSSFASGKRVRVETGFETYFGTTAGLSSDGLLQVKREEGPVTMVVAGDVTEAR